MVVCGAISIAGLLLTLACVPGKGEVEKEGFRKKVGSGGGIGEEEGEEDNAGFEMRAIQTAGGDDGGYIGSKFTIDEEEQTP